MNYAKLAATVTRLIAKNGRELTFSKLDATPTDAMKPWRGTGAQTLVSPITTKGVFVVPQTSIPTESRGLAFDWINEDLLKRARRVCIVAAEGKPSDFDDYSVVVDGSDQFKLLWGQCLQPADVKLMFVFGLAQ